MAKVKKIILYGNADCPDCMSAKAALEKAQLRYGYVDVLAGLGQLKKFLNLRDSHPEHYATVMAEGKIGIPTIVIDDAYIYVDNVADMNFEALK
jgi:glutaredoxin-related protein